jgi:hypothetical protein
MMYVLENFFQEPVNPVSVDDAAVQAILRLDPILPNPARGFASLRFIVPRTEDVTLSIVDLTGRRVRTLAAGRAEAGQHSLIWDGRDDAGHGLPAGAYWAILTAGAVGRSEKVVLIH